MHAGFERAKGMGKDEIVVITVSGRGDKDLETVVRAGDDLMSRIPYVSSLRQEGGWR